MPIPKRTRARYDAQKKFPVGCRMVHVATGEIYLCGVYASVNYCWVMRINPGRKGQITWTQLLREFELAPV